MQKYADASRLNSCDALFWLGNECASFEVSWLAFAPEKKGKAGPIVQAVKTAINEGHDELWRACFPAEGGYGLSMSFYQVSDLKAYAVVCDVERMGRGVEHGKFAWAGVSYGY